MANTFSQDASKAEHLVIMIHGLWGNPVHLDHLRDTLVQKHADRGLYILVPSSNSTNLTYDGIEVGAERIAHEVEGKIKSIEQEGGKLKKISVVGYSMGGLVARYLVGLLYAGRIFEELEPTNFTTFATPHIGIRTPNPGYGAQIWNFLGSRTLSMSGSQMYLTDNFRDTGKPLLSVLADPNSVFMKGLSLFRRKSVYANTLNDRAVPYHTASISKIDPFVKLDEVETHPLPDQEMPVVLDPENPFSPRKPLTEKVVTLRERYEQTREALPFYAFLFAFLPIAVPLFMANAGLQTFRSARRVQLHEKGGVIDLTRYRIPLLEEAQAMQDKVIEHLTNEDTAMKEASGTGYLPTPPPEPTSPVSSSSSSAKSAKMEKPVETASQWPTLALTDEQFTMIQNLDKHIGFVKYPAHIQKVRHTHAAIIVRMPKKEFAEGKMVSAHWAKEFIP